MRALAAVLIAATAAPISAQAPAFVVQVRCDGAVPVEMLITSFRPASTLITLREMIAQCLPTAAPEADEPKPVPQRLRST